MTVLSLPYRIREQVKGDSDGSDQNVSDSVLVHAFLPSSFLHSSVHSFLVLIIFVLLTTTATGEQV